MDSDAISQAVPRPTDRGRAGECILQSADRSVKTLIVQVNIKLRICVGGTHY